MASQLYSRSRLEAHVDAYLVARLTGQTITELLGIPECDDLCCLDRERWELVPGQFGAFYRCRRCHKFIGYPPPDPPPRSRGRAK